MPAWSTAEILAVHIRMHQAEGVLFPRMLCRAADACGVPLMELPEALFEYDAIHRLHLPKAQVVRQLAVMGKQVGAPWGKDQKSAALAAWVALRESRGTH
jgi:hypothetical protein